MRTTAVLTLAIAMAVGSIGCGGDGVKGVRNLDVKPRQPGEKDRWCVYTTTAESEEGAIPAQSDICVLCPRGETACDNAIRTITVADGITYNVGIGGEGSCQRCPAASVRSAWTYERR